MSGSAGSTSGCASTRTGVHPGGDRVRAEGKKELVALTDGHRESTESWAGLLRGARRRGMRAPVLAVGAG
jgi:hypothetical protein